MGEGITGLDECPPDGFINPMTTADPPSSSAFAQNLDGAKNAALDPPARKPIPEIARRALAEAEARRIERAASEAAAPNELKGRGGLDPVRYGDWEVKGIASDF